MKDLISAEPFAFCIYPGEDVFGDSDNLPDAAADELRQVFRAANLPEDQVDLEVDSTGYGADGFIVLGILGSLTALFLSGKKIEENLEAWARLGRRFRKLLADLNTGRGRTAVSQPVALALALDNLFSAFPEVESVSVIGSQLVPVANGSLYPHDWAIFRRQPDRVYIFVLRALNHDTYVIAIRSDGDIVFQHRIPTGDYLEYFGV